MYVQAVYAHLKVLLQCQSSCKFMLVKSYSPYSHSHLPLPWTWFCRSWIGEWITVSCRKSAVSHHPASVWYCVDQRTWVHLMQESLVFRRAGQLATLLAAPSPLCEHGNALPTGRTTPHRSGALESRLNQIQLIIEPLQDYICGHTSKTIGTGVSALLIPTGTASHLSTGTWGAKSWSNAGGLHSLAFEVQVVWCNSECIICMVYI